MRVSARSGAAAFAELYANEYPNQLRRASLLIGDAFAHDVVQDAFVNVLSHWAEVDVPGAYLNRAVLNGCRDHVRHHGVHERVLPRLRVAGVTGGSPEILSDALSTLPFLERAVVVLRFWSGMNQQQIADELGCPVGSIGPRLHRALATLKGQLR